MPRVAELDKHRRRRRLPVWKCLLFTVVANAMVLGLIAVLAECTWRLLAPTTRYMQLSDMPLVDMGWLQFSQDTALGWELNPRCAGHNALGLRGRECTCARASDRWRIAVIGDSVAYGLGVESEMAYPAILETILTQTGETPVEVLNFGVPGYNTAQEYAMLKNRVLAYDPDVVVMMFTTDDCETTPIIIDVDGELCLFRNQLEGLWLFNNSIHWYTFRHSHVYRFLYKQMVLAVIPSGQSFEDVYIKPDVAWKTVLRTAALCERRGIRFVLVLSPLLRPFCEPIEQLQPAIDAMQRIQQLAARSSLDVVDLGPLYDQHVGQLKLANLPLDYEHLNPRGHQLVANVLAERLLRLRKTGRPGTRRS